MIAFVLSLTEGTGMSQETINGLLAVIVPAISVLLAFILSVLNKVHKDVNSARTAALLEISELRKQVTELGGLVPPSPPTPPSA